jgi:hypothetical protein
VSCCLGCAGLPSCSQRPPHSALRLFPLTLRRKVAGAAAVGVGVAVVGAAAAVAVKSGFRRLRRRAVAAAVGAAAVGAAPAGAAAAGVAVAATGVAVAATGVAVAATGVAVAATGAAAVATGVAVVGGMAVAGVVGNLWIKAGCRRNQFLRSSASAVRTSSGVTAEEFAYLTKQMGPQGAAPSPEASMLIDEQGLSWRLSRAYRPTGLFVN